MLVSEKLTGCKRKKPVKLVAQKKKKKFRARRNNRAVNIFPGRRLARIISLFFMFPTRVCNPRSACIPLAFCGHGCNDFFRRPGTSSPRFHSIFHLTGPRNEIFYSRAVESHRFYIVTGSITLASRASLPIPLCFLPSPLRNSVNAKKKKRGD